ncbi:MAG: hypothetical protein AAGU75_02805 [Bacillota bacterium]
MNFTIILRNITGKIYRSNETDFSVDVERQKQLLSAFPEPKDLFTRSYYQYQCQMKRKAAVFGVVQNIAALVLLPVYYLILASRRKESMQQARGEHAVFFTDGISVQTIPDCLRVEYNEILPCKLAEEMYIGKQEKKMLSVLFMQYWYSPCFLFKCMLKISMYAATIEQYNPRAIISYSEYSYTSSVLTEYCRLRGVEHINIMHGEKLFNIRDTFVQYDRYYVWDEHYINLLTDLRADKEQFRIAVPHSVKFDCKRKDEPIYEYTYYLGEEKTKEMLTIRDALLRIGVPSSRTCVRYHPRYSKVKEIKRIFTGFQIENPAEVPLDISLSRTRHIVSLFSTVLYQAYASGKEIIIDDVTDKLKYEKLKKLRYIMLEKPHGKLSEYLYNREDFNRMTQVGAI